MPKKKKGKRMNNKQEVKRELKFKEDGQEYALVTKALGNKRFTVQGMDGKERLAITRGNMSYRRKVWVNIGDFVLIGLRDYQDDKCDIMAKYTMDEARTLKAYGELPAEVKINEDASFNEDDDSGCPFEFGDPSDEEEVSIDKSEEDGLDTGKIDLDDI